MCKNLVDAVACEKVQVHISVKKHSGLILLKNV